AIGASNYTAGTLTNVTISGNHGGDGGGLYVDNGSQWLFINSTISNNTADRNGGGGYVGHLRTQPPPLTPTITTNHRGQHGGGIYGYGDTETIRLTNSTVTGNSADGEGGGIFSGDNSTLILTNSIVAGNDAVIGDDLRGDSPSSNLTFVGQNIVGSAPDSFT